MDNNEDSNEGSPPLHPPLLVVLVGAGGFGVKVRVAGTLLVMDGVKLTVIVDVTVLVKDAVMVGV